MRCLHLEREANGLTEWKGVGDETNKLIVGVHVAAVLQSVDDASALFAQQGEVEGHTFI